MPRLPSAVEFGLGSIRSDPARIPLQRFDTNLDQFGALDRITGGNVVFVDFGGAS